MKKSKTKCTHCDGSGYHGKRICPKCKGTGYISKKAKKPNSLDQISGKPMDYGGEMFKVENWMPD